MARSHQARLRQRYPVLWATFVSTTRCRCPSAFLPPTSPQQCGCKKHALDVYGDHTFTCTAHSGATKAHDWMVSVLGPLFRMAGHTVRTQHGVTASAGQRRGDVEIRNFLRDQAGSRSLVFDISFLPAIMSTCTRMHGEFLRVLFLQAHRETEAHVTAAGMSSQRNQPDSFPFKRAAFYQLLKGKVGLAAAKAAALRITPQGRGLLHSNSPSARSLSRFPFPPPPSFTQSPSPPRSLVRDGQTSPHSPRLVVSAAHVLH